MAMNAPEASQGGGLGSFLETHPTVTIGGAIVAVLLVGAILLRKSTTPTPMSSTPQDLSGLATDANGNHVVYVPTSTSFTTINKTGDTTTTTTNNPPPPAPAPAPTTQTAFVRARYSSALTKAYDDAHPGGVPIRSSAGTTGNNIIRLAAFGSQITIAGPSQTGASNLPGAGSLAWLPVTGGGYISAYDVTGLQSSGNYGDGGARALPVMGPVIPVLKWDMPYTAMPGHTLASIARHVTQIAKQQGAPGSTLVSAQQLSKYNNVRQVSAGQTIMVPRWTTGGSYHA